MKTQFKKTGDVTFHEMAESHLVNMAHGFELAKAESETGFIYWWRHVTSTLDWLELIDWRQARQIVRTSTTDELTEFMSQKLPASFKLAREEFAEKHNQQIIQCLKKEYYPGV